MSVPPEEWDRSCTCLSVSAAEASRDGVKWRRLSPFWITQPRSVLVFCDEMLNCCIMGIFLYSVKFTYCFQYLLIDLLIISLLLFPNKHKLLNVFHLNQHWNCPASSFQSDPTGPHWFQLWLVLVGSSWFGWFILLNEFQLTGCWCFSVLLFQFVWTWNKHISSCLCFRPVLVRSMPPGSAVFIAMSCSC